MRDVQGDRNHEQPRGKAIIQYRPAHGCEDEARWRVFIEERGTEGRDASWTPGLNQIWTPGGTAKMQSCELDPGGNNGEDGGQEEEVEEGNEEGDCDEGQEEGNDDPAPAPTPTVTACSYTVRTVEASTDPGEAFTIPAATHTQCACNDGIRAGITTVTADNRDRVLVCQVEANITVTTLAPEPTADENDDDENDDDNSDNGDNDDNDNEDDSEPGSTDSCFRFFVYHKNDNGFLRWEANINRDGDIVQCEGSETQTCEDCRGARFTCGDLPDDIALEVEFPQRGEDWYQFLDGRFAPRSWAYQDVRLDQVTHMDTCGSK
jgi:hypothetical protein